jgi:hypothetical protein
MPDRVPRKIYKRELLRLQAELVKLQEWVRAERSALSWSLRGEMQPARAGRSSG